MFSKITSLICFPISFLGISFGHASSQTNKIIKPEYIRSNACEVAHAMDRNSMVKLEMPFNSFLKGSTLVAKEVHHQIFDMDGRVTAYSAQNFVKGAKSKVQVVCGSIPKNMEQRFVITAPTLIDETQHKKFGSSLWSFQLIPLGGGISAVHNKSPKTLENTTDIAKISGADLEVYQISHHEIEIRYVKKIGDFTQTLSMVYDIVN